MSRKQKILFGPFVGEVGWEQTFWRGYVRRFMSETRGAWEIHVASYPGRHVFYGEGVEFHAHPDWFCDLELSQRAYASDHWYGAWPRLSIPTRFAKNVSEQHERLVSHFREQIPGLAKLIAPAGLFECALDSRQIWGTFFSPISGIAPGPYTRRIELAFQQIDPLIPTARTRDWLRNSFPSMFDSRRPRILLLPRHRTGRRPDKNWPQENYRKLIELILNHESRPHVVLVGAPGGCYFANGDIPSGAVDLINVPDAMRLDLHIAAATLASFAVGGLSGAMLVMMAAGTPVIEWGYGIHEVETRLQNVLGTPLCYIPSNNPPVEMIWNLVSKALAVGRVEGLSIDRGEIPASDWRPPETSRFFARIHNAAFRRLDPILFEAMRRARLLDL